METDSSKFEQNDIKKKRVMNMGKWMNMFLVAEEYYEANKSLEIRKDEDKKLHNWINVQRARYKNGELTPEQISMLEKIGMLWDVHEKRWDDMYKRLQELYAKNKTIAVDKKEDAKLYNWTVKLKNSMQRGDLTPEQMEKLEKSGISLQLNNYFWENDYQRFLAEYQEGGGLSKNVKSWLKFQRQAFDRGELTFKQIRLLRNINFDFGVPEPDKLYEIEKLLRMKKSNNALDKYRGLAQLYIRIRNAILSEVKEKKTPKEQVVPNVVTSQESSTEFVEEVLERMKEFSRMIKQQKAEAARRKIQESTQAASSEKPEPANGNKTEGENPERAATIATAYTMIANGATMRDINQFINGRTEAIGKNPITLEDYQTIRKIVEGDER